VIAWQLRQRAVEVRPPRASPPELVARPTWEGLIDRFAATLENANTRAAYRTALRHFFFFIAAQSLSHPHEVMPHHVARYLGEVAAEGKPATVRQHLAALRALFAWLVREETIKADPTRLIRGPALARQPTPGPEAGELKRLMDSIESDSLIGLRDRALIAVIAFGCARIGAVLPMRIEDYFWVGRRRWIRLHEPNGVRRELPAHGELAAALDAYLARRDLVHPKDWLFPPLRGHTRAPLNRIDAYRIIRKRAAAAGLADKIGCQSIRAGALQQYFANGGTLAGAQRLAHLKSPRSTIAYNRSTAELTDEEIDRIRF
jgi:site-specific recombinase XerD